jgi:hypothetical protein
VHPVFCKDSFCKWPKHCRLPISFDKKLGRKKTRYNYKQRYQSQCFFAVFTEMGYQNKNPLYEVQFLIPKPTKAICHFPQTSIKLSSCNDRIDQIELIATNCKDKTTMGKVDDCLRLQGFPAPSNAATVKVVQCHLVLETSSVSGFRSMLNRNEREHGTYRQRFRSESKPGSAYNSNMSEKNKEDVQVKLECHGKYGSRHSNTYEGCCSPRKCSESVSHIQYIVGGPENEHSNGPTDSAEGWPDVLQHLDNVPSGQRRSIVGHRHGTLAACSEPHTSVCIGCKRW